MRPLSLLALLLVLPTAAAAVENLGAHRLRGSGEFERVIDRRCTVCHSRARIETALGAQRPLQPLQQKMIEQGAVLSERDKSVLGTFWGTPMKRR